MLKKHAYQMGVYAAHERITPICPFSPIYEQVEWESWFQGIADERRSLNRQR